MKHSNIFLQLLTSQRLTTREEGETILRAIEECAPELLPEKYGASEPPRTKFQSIETALSDWGGDFIWKRREPDTVGAVFPRKNSATTHAAVTLATDFSANSSNLVRLLVRLANDLKADIGFLHALTPHDIERWRNLGIVTLLDPAKETYNLFISTHTLRRGIPDLWWGTIFGRSYVQQFGRERLLSAPALTVTEVATDMIYVQLTASLKDVERDVLAFDATRNAVKVHLCHQAFQDLSGDAATKF